jgi:hypothetical protein
VNIPEGKTIGDEITFANPNIPGKNLSLVFCKSHLGMNLSLTIIGTFSFSNSLILHVFIGQKLKVAIPAKADMEKRTFVASVPGPKVPFTKKENILPKEFRDALSKC